MTVPDSEDRALFFPEEIVAYFRKGRAYPLVHPFQAILRPGELGTAGTPIPYRSETIHIAQIVMNTDCKITSDAAKTGIS